MKKKGFLLQSLFGALLALLLSAPPLLAAIDPTQDTDGDDIPDVEEDTNGNEMLDAGETDRYNADTDGGGEADGSEKRANRNPLDPQDDLTADPDGDGCVNWLELLNGTDPRNRDTDADGLIDCIDPFPLDSKFKVDENRNKLPDEWEQKTGLSTQPTAQKPTDDPDGDSLTNAQELARGTNPLKTDTDRDGVDDKTETEEGTDPKENACLSYTANATPFPDIVGHWSEPFVTTLRGISILPKNLPLIRGYGSDAATALFAPNQAVTRYEFSKMVLLSTCTKLITLTEKESRQFSDVRSAPVIGEHPDFVFRRQVIYSAAHYGIVEGYADGTFLPDNPINRAEAVKILVLSANLTSETGSGTLMNFPDVLEGEWFKPYVDIATIRGIVQGYVDGLFRPGNYITRAEAAKIVERAMRQNPSVNWYVLPEDKR